MNGLLTAQFSVRQFIENFIITLFNHKYGQDFKDHLV